MVKFLKIRDVKNPERRFGDAGFDVYVPNYSEQFINDLRDKNPNIDISEEGIKIGPGEAINIPTGLKTKFPPTIALEANNKSGVATKKHLVYGASVVDSGYQGEIHAHLINVGTEVQLIKYGEKIVQFIPRLIDTDEHEVYENMTDEEFYEGVTTERGAGAFGSTGIGL